MKQQSLYYREGSSDKEYHARIEPAGEQFDVTYAYGRRGSTLTTGKKTSSPVDLQAATRIFEALVKEKKAKGYTEGESGIPYQQSSQEVSGHLPQLLNPIEEADLPTYLADPNYCAQEKVDGKRVMILKAGAHVTGINRKGLHIGLHSDLVSAAQVFKGDFLLDGECIGIRYEAFDLLQRAGECFTGKPYRARYLELMNLLFSGQQRFIGLVETTWDTTTKTRMLKELRERGREGIVFKQMYAPYSAGRPASGGSQLKHKFYCTASVLVAGLNRQRSVQMQLLEGGEWLDVGNVTIPPSQAMPEPGQVVEVRYLYAYRRGSLYQPTYKGVRPDVFPDECTVSQLKFKTEP